MISEGTLDVLAKREEKKIERTNVYFQLSSKYGVDKQLIVANEELSELQK